VHEPVRTNRDLPTARHNTKPPEWMYPCDPIFVLERTKHENATNNKKLLGQGLLLQIVNSCPPVLWVLPVALAVLVAH